MGFYSVFYVSCLGSKVSVFGHPEYEILSIFLCCGAAGDSQRLAVDAQHQYVQGWQS